MGDGSVKFVSDTINNASIKGDASVVLSSSGKSGIPGTTFVESVWSAIGSRNGGDSTSF
jgi:hypothetical protein